MIRCKEEEKRGREEGRKRGVNGRNIDKREQRTKKGKKR